METKSPAKAVIVDYTCDKCGSGKMRATGIAYMSHPAQYPHICDNIDCKNEKTFRGQTYPYTIFVKDES